MFNNVKLGIAPIGWTNDDMPQLGGELTFEQMVSEAALAGFQGTEVGGKFPTDPAVLNKALDLRGIKIASQWFSSFLCSTPYEENEKAFIEQLDFLEAVGASRINVCELTRCLFAEECSMFGDNKPIATDEEWDKLCDGLNKLGKIAADRGFKLCFHHHMATVVQTFEETKRLMDNTDPRYVYLCFDPSYAEAKEKIRAGAIGKPILFKGVSLDPSSVLEAHLEGVKKGIYVPWFIEMGSHDTDLARWFLEGDPVDSFATGDAYVCTGLADYNDYDNGFSLTKFDNNTTAYIQVGRTATCSHVESEIVGTKGTLRVNSVPRKNYLSQFTENGFVEECQESFLARWGEAFQAEIDDFVDCVRTGRKPETTAHDGTMSLKFCLQLHQAYLDGKKK